MMGIASGLMSSPISRMKKCWKLLPAKVSADCEYFSQLCVRNYKLLREAVKQSQIPCLPYLGVYLSDLTFIADGNADKIEDLINFEKR